MIAEPEGPILDDAALERIRRIGGEKLLQQMVALCLERFASLQSVAREALASGDLAAAARAAHSMKSSAGNLGAHRLMEVCQRIEGAAADSGEDPLLLATALLREVDAASSALRALRPA